MKEKLKKKIHHRKEYKSITIDPVKRNRTRCIYENEIDTWL